jgi:hypothetical protein
MNLEEVRNLCTRHQAKFELCSFFHIDQLLGGSLWVKKNIKALPADVMQ